MSSVNRWNRQPDQATLAPFQNNEAACVRQGAEKMPPLPPGSNVVKAPDLQHERGPDFWRLPNLETT